MTGRTLRRGFTLIELLVVMGIIVLLLSILMPAVGKARDAVNGMVCESHVRTLTQATLLFAADHDGHLPGTRYAYWVDRNPDHYDWLYGEYSMYRAEGHTLYEQLDTAPQYGTIYKYVNKVEVYRCPALQPATPGVGYGSNGRFDYAMFAVFGGAQVRDIKIKSQLYFPIDPTMAGTQNLRSLGGTSSVATQCGFSRYMEDQPTPIICQEDPLFGINSSAFTGFWLGEDCPNGQHGGIKRIGHMHSGGSYYGSIDGSTVWINEPDYINPDPSTGIYPDEVWQTGAGLWWQDGPQTHQPRRLDQDWNDPWHTIVGWGAWSHK